MWKSTFWDFKYIASKIFSTEKNDHDSDYTTNILTNFNSNIFQSTTFQTPIKKTIKIGLVALRTQNLIIKRWKLYLFYE